MNDIKLYATELIPITTPGENIVALDKLRAKYGNPERDERGSYWRVDDEVMQCLPTGITIDAILQEQSQPELETNNV